MYATKARAEDCLNIDTKWLKDHGYFCGYRRGVISWTYGWSDFESSVSLSVDTMDSPNIHFRYTETARWGDEKMDMDYSFPLVKVPCNLGGFRWAFKCSLYKNGIYCGRTAYALYQGNSGYFGCRHCANITYQSQRRSGSRLEYFGRALENNRKACELYDSIKKWSYKGRPTKKVLKLRRLERMIPSNPEMLGI